MTPEKFIRRVREIIPGSQKLSLPQLLRRIEVLQNSVFDYLKLESYPPIDFDDYGTAESPEGQPDSVQRWEPAAVGEDHQRDTLLLSGNDREPTGVREQARLGGDSG